VVVHARARRRRRGDRRGRRRTGRARRRARAVFDPYFTTKTEGTGLGLAIVKKIVVEHNGAISAEKSERLGGAAFVVALPPPHSLAIAAVTHDAAEAGPLSRSGRRSAA
jgi:hypothetical protein